METSDPIKPDTTPPNRRWSGALIAAAGFATVIVLVGLFALLGRGGTDGPTATTEPTAITEPTTTAPTTTTTTAPTTTTTTEPTTTTAAAAELFPGLPEPVDELVPGGYAVRMEPIPFSFVVPDDGTDFSAGAAWIDQPEMPGPGIVAVPSSTTPGGLIAGSLVFAMTRAEDGVETVVADLTAEIPVSEPAETTVGGRPAIQLDVDGSVGDRPFSSLSGESGVAVNLLGETFRYRLYVVDAPDGTLVVLLEVAEEEVDTLFPYWEENVDSIEFAPVTP